MSVESNILFALVFLYNALWLVNKTRATFSTDHKPNQNQSCLARPRFPALVKSSSDWFIALLVCVVIGQRNYFGLVLRLKTALIRILKGPLKLSVLTGFTRIT